MQPASRISRRWPRWQWATLCGVALGLVLVLSACVGSPTSAPESTVPTLPPGCTKASTLTLVSEVGFGTEAAQAFQQQTGITINVDPYADYYDTPSKLPGQWDIMWFDSQLAAQRMDRLKQLLPWDSPNVGNYTSLGKSFIPTDHAYYPVTLTAATAIVYNLHQGPAVGLPTTWTDLLKPVYKNRVAETSIFWSTPTYTTATGVAQLLGGPDQGKQFLLGLKVNGAEFPATDDLTLKDIESGARTFGIVQDSSYYLAKQHGQPLGIIYPSSGVIALTTDLGMAAKSRNQDCAQKFVNWVLSSTGQTVLTHHNTADAQTYFVPLVSGVIPVAPRRVAGIPFVLYSVVKWEPIMLNQRLWVNDHIQSVQSALRSVLEDPSQCSIHNC